MHNLTEEEKHYEKYIDVAMELLTTDAGVSPSVRALIERVGGSMTTANKAMRVFWGYVGRRLSYDQQYPDGMPLEVIKLMEKVIAMARDTAKKELKAEWIKVGEHAKELEKNKVLMKQFIDRLSQEVDQEKNHNLTLQNELESVKQSLTTAKSENDVLTRENDALAHENKTFDTELSRTKRDFENLNARLKESDDNQRNQQNEIKTKSEQVIAIELHNQTLTERVDNHAKKETEYKAELDKCRKKIEILEDRNLLTQQALGEKNAALARMEVEVIEGNRYKSKLEADLEFSIKRHSHLEDQLSKKDSELLELRPLKLRLDEIIGQVSDLRGERDRLIKLLDEKVSARKSRKKSLGRS